MRRDGNNMRIWHEDLIPKLCRQHLLAMWREGLGCYKILTENKKGYRNHPAVKEFEDKIEQLWLRLNAIRSEMIKRGYKPKDLQNIFTTRLQAVDYGLGDDRQVAIVGIINSHYEIEDWQILDEQIKVLKNKGCDCQV